MAFVKGDARINRSGRPTDDERLNRLSKRQLKQKELLMLLRKIRPHVADSIMRAALIMKDEKAGAQNNLRAATILLEQYRKLVMDLYDGEVDPEEEAPEIQQENRPIFSLKVVDGDKEE
jgi:hypothetical protein